MEKKTAKGRRIFVREAEADVVGDPQMIKNTENWLSDIWGIKEVQGFAAVCRAIICGCGRHKTRETTEFYEFTEPSLNEAHYTLDALKGMKK